MTATVQTSGTPALETIELDRIHESPLNPRKIFDAAKLAELATSLKAKGQLTPCLVRPNAKGFELAAGHRRYRAAKLAGLTSLLCLVRPMADADFLEVLVVENDQREDVHPLEEARGYKSLLECQSAKYDIPRIAARVGRSESYVYDRLKLLQLIKPLQELFLGGAITAGHAVILARLAPADQERVMGNPAEAFEDGGLFNREHGIFETPEQERADDEAFDALVSAARKRSGGKLDLVELVTRGKLRAVGVRQLQSFVNDKVRLDPEAKDFVELFPETHAEIRKATASAVKVVMITREFTIADEARREDEKVIGPRSWQQADGEPDDDGKATKGCDHAVLGVVAVGPGRGESFAVCIAKDKCATHWPDHVKAARERAKRAKAAAEGKPVPASKVDKERQRYEAAEARRRAEQQRQESERERWQKASPQLFEALAAAIKKAPAGAASAVATAVINELRDYDAMPLPTVEKYIGRGKSAEDALRFAAFIALSWNKWNVMGSAPKALKIFGLDAKKIVDEACPPAKAEPVAKTKKGKK